MLQQKVTCPIGCNNPCCLDLRGVSEVVVPGKVCTECLGARYCSRDRHVLHWSEHKVQVVAERSGCIIARERTNSRNGCNCGTRYSYRYEGTRING